MVALFLRELFKSAIITICVVVISGISMAQVMRIVLSFGLESNRLLFLKDNFMRIYDLENYTYARDVFTHEPYRNDWLSFASASLSQFNPPPVSPCEVGPAEFEQAVAAIAKENSSNTRLIVAKQVISAKKCLWVNQIKEIMAQMSFESVKLEIAKYAYDYCRDTENYFMLNDALSFSSSKTDLINFVNGKK